MKKKYFNVQVEWCVRKTFRVCVDDTPDARTKAEEKANQEFDVAFDGEEDHYAQEVLDVNEIDHQAECVQLLAGVTIGTISAIKKARPDDLHIWVWSFSDVASGPQMSGAQLSVRGSPVPLLKIEPVFPTPLEAE